MVRKQLLLTPEQSERIRAAAAASRESESELVRQAIDAWLETRPAKDDDWKAQLLAQAGVWKDYTGIEEMVARRRLSWARRIRQR